MCNCVETINKKLNEANLNTKIKIPILLTDDLALNSSKLQVVTEKSDASVRKKPTSLFTSFCPFCGEQHKKD